MEPLAWMVTWVTLGATRRTPFVDRRCAQAWRDRQSGSLRPLVPCLGSAAPAAWLVHYGDSLQHRMVTLDGEDAHRYAVKTRGWRQPLMLG